MSLGERIKLIMHENNLKQKELAATLGISESYISTMVNERISEPSRALAMLIEEKYGYSKEWILNGTEPKMKQFSKDKSLSDIHQKALYQLEKMDDKQVKAVLAFINSLDEIEEILKDSKQNTEQA